MTDPYFQTLFADRIGGVNYGKGTEIYKFEKIKHMLAARPWPSIPSDRWSISALAKTTKWRPSRSARS